MWDEQKKLIENAEIIYFSNEYFNILNHLKLTVLYFISEEITPRYHYNKLFIQIRII